VYPALLKTSGHWPRQPGPESNLRFHMLQRQRNDGSPRQHLELPACKGSLHLGASEEQQLLLLQIISNGLCHPMRMKRQDQMSRACTAIAVNGIWYSGSSLTQRPLSGVETTPTILFLQTDFLLSASLRRTPQGRGLCNRLYC
jgi:hypothetical protein